MKYMYIQLQTKNICPMHRHNIQPIAIVFHATLNSIVTIWSVFEQLSTRFKIIKKGPYSSTQSSRKQACSKQSSDFQQTNLGKCIAKTLLTVFPSTSMSAT